jgi:hypothetical protein
MFRPARSILLVTAVLTSVPGLGLADDRFGFNLVLDGRVVTTPASVGFLDSGLGKARYGHQPRAVQVKLGQASLLGRFEPRYDLTLQVQANVDAEHDFGRRLDLVEALVRYRPVLSDRVSLDIRAGSFFPTLSLENTDLGWLSPYTTTFSAINSWIGEEVRTLGVEAGPVLRIGDATHVRAFGTLGRGNDPSGTLLAWRGFTLHDRVSGYGDRLPLPALTSLNQAGLFPDQPGYVEPMREVDEKWTWSSGLSVAHPDYRLRVLYQPATADPGAFDGQQYAWRTSYWSVGASRFLGPVEFLAQGLDGETRMGVVEGVRNAVVARFQAAYFLASWSEPQEGKHRATVRYDVFRVRDRDEFPTLDANDESGTAWTLAYVFTPSPRHRITAELVDIRSTRSNRRDLGLAPRSTEILGTLSWRLTF